MTNLWLSTGWLIPLYPLVGALLSLPWSPGMMRRTGPRPAGYLNMFTTLLAFVHSLGGLLATWQQPAFYFEVNWLQVADLTITLPFELSALSLGAAVIITGLNLLVQVYTIGYLEMDWGWARFYALLALFEAGMTALVLGDSVFLSYMLLEILTLGTYLIVGYWFNQSLVVTGARDAFLTKRVGDLVLLMAVIALYPLAGTWSFSGLAEWSQTADLSASTAALLGIGLIAGPMSKCAQFPLHLWLDEAMEGPLPASILRNATVVPVGAWVLIKLVPVLGLSPLASQVAIAVGAITAIGSGLIACAQIDIKRVLSYLVSAYMGLVFVAVGSQQAGAAFFLLLTYALAMATLVAAGGSVILTCVTQDLTQLGGLWSRRPVTGLSFLIGTFGFIAMPPLGGFWSMRSLVDGLWQAQSWLLIVLILTVNWLMAFSLMRAFALMFMGPTQIMSARAPEPIWSVVLPMASMAGLTLHVPIILESLNLLPLWQMTVNSTGLLLFWSSFTGAMVGYILYRNRQLFSPKILPQWLVDLFAYDFYTPTLYRNTVVLAVGLLARLGDWLDRYVVDGLVNAIGLASLVGGETLKYGNTGRSQFYLLTIAGFTVLIALFMGWLYLPVLQESL
ncbi:MAG: NAD(P)H-quinone oxidoreductase subunit F [Leptolyngbyaceae cyanobacterium]